MLRAGLERDGSASGRQLMRSLYPTPDSGDGAADDAAEVDPLAAIGAEERLAAPGRPYVLANMIASADGATALEGVSGGLGGPADQQVFAALRSVSDAIVVGAATASVEGYKPPGLGSDAVQAARAGRGQAARPLVVVITASLSLGPDEPLFANPDYRPLIATVATAPADRRAALAEVADVVTVGDDRVDLGRVLAVLAERNLSVVMSEGGPSLNGQLVAADLIDEWNLAISPILAAGDSARPAHGPPLPHPAAPMQLRRVWLADELLFCRWTR